MSLVVLIPPCLLAVQVTCGSTIKLVHSPTGARLHSHGVAYSRGSQQQSVTGYPDSENSQSYWIVHGTKVSGARAQFHTGD